MKNKLPIKIKELLQKGTVIPAHPTALTEDLKIDSRRQRALTRYYKNCWCFRGNKASRR